jgi:hypothetical protein
MATPAAAPTAVSYTNADGSINWDAVLGTGISTGVGLYGASQASGQQAAGDQAAIGTQQSTLAAIQGQYGTQSAVGNAAIATAGNTVGVGGGPANYANFYNSPGYQYQVSQGINAVDRTAAANGSLYTPNTLTSIGMNVAGQASGTYQNYLQNLMGVAGFGTSANQNISQSIYGTGANTSQLQTGIGNANAAGTAATTAGLAGLPYGSILSGVSSLFGGSTAGSANNTGVYNPTSGTNVSVNPGTPSAGDITDAQNGYLNMGNSGDTGLFGS